MKDIKVYMTKEEYERYRLGQIVMGIKAESYFGLIKKYSRIMFGLNILVKVNPAELLYPVERDFSISIIPGWYYIMRRTKEWKKRKPAEYVEIK